MKLFHWTTVDVRPLLPGGWQGQVMRVARERQERWVLVTGHSSSREARADTRLATACVPGTALRQELPWLWQLYENEFRSLAECVAAEPVACGSDERFAIALNVQTGSERAECHVDTNPVAALLYCTTHREGAGGELVVSNTGDVGSVAEVEADRAVIEPKAGHLVLFDARAHSHYVRPLMTGNVRVAAAMNYYTATSPEAQVRPPDMNRHLSGSD